MKGYVCARTLSIEKLANSNNSVETDNANTIEKSIDFLYVCKISIPFESKLFSLLPIFEIPSIIMHK
jgi:hypothetical protein